MSITVLSAVKATLVFKLNLRSVWPTAVFQIELLMAGFVQQEDQRRTQGSQAWHEDSIRKSG